MMCIGRKSQVLAFLLVLVFVLILFNSFTAFANSAAPSPPDNSSGIVFKEHEYVQIESEVLDIYVQNDASAKISATYIMKNTSSQSLNVETMFISPVEYGYNQEIYVLKNGQHLDWTQYFYAPSYLYDNSIEQHIDDWEAILGSIKQRSNPFGDGTGFYEYRIKSSNYNEIYAKFRADTYYFQQSQRFDILNDGTIELRNYKTYDGKIEDIVIVTKHILNLETNGNLLTTQIYDIYDYLYSRATENAYEEQLRFSEQQFNLYLFNFNANSYHQDFFYLHYVESYISGITYFVDFAPGEEIEIKVSYIYKMGVPNTHSASLHYFLSPAKYWKDFGDIEINIYLSDKYKKLIYSSIYFDKIDEYHYQFVSSILPQTELEITVSDGDIFSGGYVVFIIIIFLLVVFLILPIVLLIVLINHTDRRKHYNT